MTRTRLVDGRGAGLLQGPLPRLARAAVAFRLAAAGALAAGLLALAPAANARTSGSLTLVVSFSLSGTITVSLPDGTPVGTTGGQPSVIPAGYYTLALRGPGGCAYLPVFQLKGPGENVESDMIGGEEEFLNINVYLQPNSTYTWLNESDRSVVYTFKTSASIGGATPSPAPHVSAPGGQTVSSKDLVGSDMPTFRGTLKAAVRAGGILTLGFRGRRVSSLKAGRYTVSVDDRSSTRGFRLGKVKHPARSVTTAAFVGKHSTSVRLTAGRWSFSSGLQGKPAYFTVVG